MTRRAAGIALVVLAALALSPPSSAAPQRWSRIGLSLDGHTWTPRLHAPLFDGAQVWVPGCAPKRTFYVRNQSRHRAALAVGLRVIDRTGALQKHGFRMAIRTGERAWHRVRSADGFRLGHVVVGLGHVVPVSVRLRLLPSAGNRTMKQHLTFTVRVRLTRDISKVGDR